MRNSRYMLAALAATVSLPASAEPARLDVQPESQWRHEPTSITFPPLLAGLKRDAVTAYLAEGLDVSPNYASADGSEAITFYLYRNVSGNAPLWFDRARTIITLLPDKYANPKSLGARPFTPRGQSVSSGLIESFAVEGRFRSTAQVVFPMNGFYVKVRASSRNRDPAALEALLLSAVNAFDWSSRVQEQAAKPVRDCAAPLPQREPAEQAELSEDDSILSALIGGAVAQVSATQAQPVAIDYCREPRPAQIGYGIYRPDGADNRYIMAILDAGRAIWVGGQDVSQLLAEARKEPAVPVSFVELQRTSTFAPFKTPPRPEQVVALVEGSRPLSVATTWGTADRAIRIDAGD